MKGFSSVTAGRLTLLGLYYKRCEDRLRGRLAQRVRQQVQDEAVADMEVHRKLMHPSSGCAAADRVGGGRVGGRSGGGGVGGGGSGGGGGGAKGRGAKGDGVGELMQAVAELRIRSALEELETRSSLPAVRMQLLEGLLDKVGLLLICLGFCCNRSGSTSFVEKVASVKDACVLSRRANGMTAINRKRNKNKSKRNATQQHKNETKQRKA